MIARPSAESELYGLVRASCEALGLQALGDDLGHTCFSRIHIDSTSVKSIAGRTGFDKVRHIDVNVLWLHEQCVRERLPFHNVLGSSNPADLMSKYLTAVQIDTCIQFMHVEFRGGRAQAAAELRLLGGVGRTLQQQQQQQQHILIDTSIDQAYTNEDIE